MAHNQTLVKLWHSCASFLLYACSSLVTPADLPCTLRRENYRPRMSKKGKVKMGLGDFLGSQAAAASQPVRGRILPSGPDPNRE